VFMSNGSDFVPHVQAGHLGCVAKRAQSLSVHVQCYSSE